MFMIKKQKNYCLRSKKNNGQGYFSSNGEKYNSVVVITIMFLYFDVKIYFLTHETTTTMTFKLKMDQTMTPLVRVTLNP